MTDEAKAAEKAKVTVRDIMDQNVDKVFPHGLEVPEAKTTDMTVIAARPSSLIPGSEEIDAAKLLAMSGPFIPEFIQGQVGRMLAAMQIAKRYSKYDARTNSWITFDPLAVASCIYIVEGKGGAQQVGYTSQFIGAVLDMFVPWSSRMRYRYSGDGDGRRCLATATLKGDAEPFEYQTPPLGTIFPKNSPLWKADPDRQLAYYARRAWARLYAPGVLLGIYDVDELDGDIRQHRGPDNARDITEAANALHTRLATAAAANGDAPAAGFHRDVVAQGLQEPAEAAPGKATGAAKAKGGTRGKAKAGKRAGEAPIEPEAPPGKQMSMLDQKGAGE